jgi:hypothetical protein
VIFSAQFNKNVDWRIEITGLESGAVRRIEGFSRTIQAENATWTGGTTILPFFRAEMCAVQLIIPEEPDFLDSANVEILGTKVYEGNLITDFEANPGNSIQVGDFEFELAPESGRKNDVVAGQGEYFFRLAGTDNASGGPTDNFFVGLAVILPSINGETYFQVPTTNPQNLHLNYLLGGVGSPYTRAIISIHIDSNNNGQFDDGPDQGIEFPIDPSYNGWRLQSFSFAETGLTSEQLSKLVACRLILISLNNLQPSPREEVEFKSDFITFTAGGPLQL